MAREAPKQFPLELPVEERLGAEDFFVAEGNRAAHALVTRWPDWPDRIVLLVGPEGAGKSHLAAIWEGMSEAARARDAGDALRLLQFAPDQPSHPAALGRTGPAAPPPILLDDCDAEGADETALFHLLNALRERRGAALLTARDTPTPLWPKLPDLVSRMRALPVARLEPPDDAAARAVLVKLLDDRQLRVEADVVEFLARRSERSLGAIRALVEALDRESLARGRAVGRGLASDVLARIWERGETE